ncbi:MAG: efflux RND transporter periplasmic adaptor subunit [Niastella sp.]|nr:efflux RND transporter periplasmic adaptor subunit [Niastella sp.]
MNRSILIAALLPTLLWGCRHRLPEMVHPRLMPITEAVFATGHLEAAGQFTLTALNEGYLQQVLVREGDTVLKGAALFVQDNAAASIQERAAAANLAIVQEQSSDRSAVLQQLQAQLATAQEKRDSDQEQLNKLERLYATHSVAEIEVTNARLAFTSSLNNVKGLEQQIAATRQELQQAVISSRSQWELNKTNTDYYTLRAPDSYVVYSILKKQGELVRKGEALAVLGKADQPIVVLSIDEAGIARVKPGQPVLVELNTDKGKAHQASISRIYPQFDVTLQAYKAEALFATSVPSLVNGTLLQANIITGGKDKALLIPREYLLPNGLVLVKHNKQIDTVAIKSGIVSNEWVEVLHGLSTDHLLVKPAQ